MRIVEVVLLFLTVTVLLCQSEAARDEPGVFITALRKVRESPEIVRRLIKAVPKEKVEVRKELWRNYNRLYNNNQRVTTDESEACTTCQVLFLYSSILC